MSMHIMLLLRSTMPGYTSLPRRRLDLFCVQIRAVCRSDIFAGFYAFAKCYGCE